MKIQPFEKRLKNGKVVSIRECLASESASLLTLIRQYLQTSPFLLLQAYEFQMDEQTEYSWIQDINNKKNSLLLVATYDGKFIANLDLTGGARERIQHTAVLGMGILDEWRNMGLGSILLQTAIQWAKKNPILEKLWLQVYAENEAAIHLYAKMGFEIEGVQKKFIKRTNGTSDNLLMGLDVS